MFFAYRGGKRTPVEPPADHHGLYSTRSTLPARRLAHHNAHMLPTVSDDLIQLAQEQGLTVYQLTLLALRALSPMIVPIPGSKTREHILENLATAKMRLTAETLRRIAEIMGVLVEAFRGM